MSCGPRRRGGGGGAAWACPPACWTAVAVGGARNAGILAVQILAISRPDLREDLHTFRKAQQTQVAAMSARVREAQG